MGRLGLLYCKVVIGGGEGGDCLSFSEVSLLFRQSSVEALEPVLSKEVSCGGEIGHFLLAGHHPGVPQHSHHRLRALQPARVAH